MTPTIAPQQSVATALLDILVPDRYNFIQPNPKLATQRTKRNTNNAANQTIALDSDP
ncbi:hypothetical protein ACN4EK_30355 [Pantanalinema rosaneae CENA516]|uniref:hypothetical protein n=1 Tax=Pantanalinema rosaneae TaxID=1620701 RepID=UPI003D6F0A1A